MLTPGTAIRACNNPRITSSILSHEITTLVTERAKAVVAGEGGAPRKVGGGVATHGGLAQGHGVDWPPLPAHGGVSTTTGEQRELRGQGVSQERRGRGTHRRVLGRERRLQRPAGTIMLNNLL